MRINDIGVFSTLVENCGYEGPPEWSEGVALLLPKIDASLLLQAVGFFREAYRRYGPVEALVHIYWSPTEKSYYVYCPNQRVTGISIRAEWDNERDKEDVLVCEIHSHHVMDAFFSSTDDEYEKATRFYAVVGNIENFFPDVRLRYANARRHFEVPLDTLFEMRFPKEWLKKLELLEQKKF
ncbi:MAG: Mov34/MPN/PAD-1 family protein [Desulfotomaculales bacterium]